MIMRWLAAILILFSPPLSAQNHFVAQDRDILAAQKCHSIPTVAEMEGELVNIYKKSKSVKIDVFTLDGFVLKNSPREALDDLHSLTSNKAFVFTENEITAEELRLRAKKRPPDEIDRKHGRSFDLSVYQRQAPQCSNVICAVKSIFGAEEGVKILWAYKKLGLNLSRYQFVHGIDFPSADLDAAIHAMMIMPERLHSTIAVDGKGFFRFRKGYRMATVSGTTVANAFGAVFDPFDEYSPAGKVGVLVHEMCHRSAYVKLIKEPGDDIGRPLDHSSLWLAVSGWKLTGKSRDVFKKDAFSKPATQEFVSDYAGENPFEDFAETCSAYRLSPRHLKTTSPAKYEFMRAHVFAGQEYLEQICPPHSAPRPRRLMTGSEPAATPSAGAR